MTKTLKDVAAVAGVSYQTVSRAINGHPAIRPETREKVMKIVERVGYATNRLAGGLRAGRSRAIGLIISDIENLFFAEVVSAVETEAALRGYSVLLANTGEELARERNAVIAMTEQRVEGIIIAPAKGDHAYLRGRSLCPLVAINRHIGEVPCGAVLLDNVSAAYAATKLLVERGHRDIGAVIGDRALMTSRERRAGFEAALRDSNLPLLSKRVHYGGLRAESGRQAGLKLLGGARRPQAVLASSNMNTAGLLYALKQLGLRRPDDIDVVGFDVPFADLLDPPLATIVQPTYEMGRLAVEHLFELLGGETSPRVLRVPALLSRGESEEGRTIPVVKTAPSSGRADPYRSGAGKVRNNRKKLAVV